MSLNINSIKMKEHLLDEVESVKQPVSKSQGFTSYQVLLITLLALTQFTVVLDFMVMNPLGYKLMKSMNLSTSQFGIVVSSYAFSAFASGIVTAGVADRFDRKKMLLFFYIGFLLGTLFCGNASNYSMMVIARIITGIFGGVIGSISMAIVSDIFPLQKRGRVMGFIQMGFAASQVLGIPISLFLANKWGWQSPFFMIVFLAFIICLLIGLFVKPITTHLDGKNEKNVFIHFGKTLVNKRYVLGFIFTALLSIGGYMIMPWGSKFAVNNLHVTDEQLPFLFMFAGISVLIVMPMVGKLSDKIDKFVIFTVASLFTVIIVMIYTNLSPVSFWIISVLQMLMMAGIMSRFVPSQALISALPEMHDRGAFMSINSSLQQLAGGIGAVVGALIVFQKDNDSQLENYNVLGYVIAFFAIVCIFILYQVRKSLK